MDGLKYWANKNRCDENPSTSKESEEVEKITWNNCKEESKVIHFKNSDSDPAMKSNHAWPGINHYTDNSKYRPSYEIDATEKIFDFFNGNLN